MEISIQDFLKTVDEKNRAIEMALRHAASILSDLMELTPEGRGVMVKALNVLISGEREGKRTLH